MRVMTFNTWNYESNWPIRRKGIVDLIEKYQPDAVALQETRHDPRFERGKGQGDQLADASGYHATSRIGQVYLPLIGVDEGLTILTRIGPSSVTLCRLTIHPHLRNDENRRLCLGVTIPVEGVNVHVFDTHFSLDPQARITNALEVFHFVKAESGQEAAFLMGDLNAEPHTPPIRFLTGEGMVRGESADFLDCWTAANPDQPGYTYASNNPVRRIDYILGRNLRRVRSAMIVGDRPVGNVYPSDHLGILVDADIRS